MRYTLFTCFANEYRAEVKSKAASGVEKLKVVFGPIMIVDLPNTDFAEAICCDDLLQAA